MREEEEERAMPTKMPVSEDELVRRKALVAEILALSEEVDISPMTTAELIRQVRRDAMRKFGKS